MNLRKVRFRLTAIFVGLLAVVVAIMALLAANSGTDRIIESAERDLDDVMTEAIIDGYEEGEDSFPNTWVVNPGLLESQALGDTWVEPPLFSIADGSWDGVGYSRFEQDGPWMAAGRLVADDTFIVSAIAMDDADAQISSLRWRFGLSVAGLVLVAALGSWQLAERTLTPARRAVEQQRDFIADAAHELRTPLAIIQASASQALSRDREAWEYQRSLAEIQVATERAGTGVNSLLELARLEAGEAVPRLAPLRLDLLIEEVVAGTRMDAAVVEAGELAPVIVSADYALLRQALSNVVRNAGARADRVWLELMVQDSWAVAEVRDDGPGFDADVLPHVFTRFRRGDEKGASGLGMAIVKSIVDLHGGSIEAQNRTEGGAVVSLKLKLSSE